ncbi:MAG: hypothetical protein QNK30_14885 [Bacteroidales bacterium]|nr:hypothetical protein [Bacteroidales bacterium]
MKIKKEDLEVKMEGPGTAMRGQSMGGLIVSYNTLPKGTDFTPLLKGLNNDSCHSAHWGYILEGKMRIIYDNGKEEVTSAGEVYYWPAGHTAIVEEDIKFVEFSPEKEFGEVLSHVFSVMQA